MMRTVLDPATLRAALPPAVASPYLAVAPLAGIAAGATVSPTLTYTFDPSLALPRDRVRAAIGDRDMADPLRSDQEVDATVAFCGEDELLATAVLAEGLAAEYARRVDSYSESGGISVRWGERIRTWLVLAENLRAAINAATIDAGSGGVDAVAVRLGAGGWVSEYVADLAAYEALMGPFDRVPWTDGTG